MLDRRRRPLIGSGLTTAAAKGPPLFDLVEAMGREATDRHLASFLELLRAGAQAPA